MDYPTFNPLLGALITNKMCSYAELKTTLNIFDCFKMYEVLEINQINDSIVQEYFEGKAKRG